MRFASAFQLASPKVKGPFSLETKLQVENGQFVMSEKHWSLLISRTLFTTSAWLRNREKSIFLCAHP
jgi:hypothetical protein